MGQLFAFKWVNLVPLRLGRGRARALLRARGLQRLPSAAVHHGGALQVDPELESAWLQPTLVRIHEM
jgi:hypothetical protein